MDKKISPALITALKRLLASEYSLHSKLWGFHWNLIGSDFAERHALYGEWADDLEADIDVLAERIRQLGEVSLTGLTEMASLSGIKDTPSALMDEAETAAVLLEDHCVLCQAFYKAIEIAEQECKVTNNILS